MKSTLQADNTAAEAVCTTQEAAKVLGISVTSVQQLVETGVLQAWKTRGGHRRIPVAAVQAFKSVSRSAPQSTLSQVASTPSQVASAPAQDQRIGVLVVEDNPIQRAIYQKQLSLLDAALEVTFCENGYHALIEIARRLPDILLVDIVMDGIDGYEVINTIMAYPELADIHIAIITSLSADALVLRGGIPAGVVYFQKPVNYDELRGYLRACCAHKLRAKTTILQ